MDYYYASHPSTFSSSFSDISGHRVANYSLDLTPDTSTFLSQFSYIRGHYEAKCVMATVMPTLWNRTCAADVVVVDRGYTIDQRAIKHY